MMKYIFFDDGEKIKLFDEIAGHFYNANFGQMSKSDIELMMFNIYMKKMISDNTNSDGSIDYNKCSDYKISQDLGITQQKVRNLKIKNQLINPIQYDWKVAFANLIKYARYDDGKIIINILDPNLYIEIQNFIEEQGAYIEKQLNSKILQLRVEYFIELVISVETSKNREKIIKEIKKQFKATNKDENIFDENNIGKSMIDAAVNATSIAANITGMLSPNNIIGKAVMDFIAKV